jgi:hypothetical protein
LEDIDAYLVQLGVGNSIPEQLGKDLDRLAVEHLEDKAGMAVRGWPALECLKAVCQQWVGQSSGACCENCNVQAGWDHSEVASGDGKVAVPPWACVPGSLYPSPRWSFEVSVGVRECLSANSHDTPVSVVQLGLGDQSQAFQTMMGLAGSCPVKDQAVNARRVCFQQGTQPG